MYGKYARADLPALLANSRCGIAAILSVWPETYSYTLSEALYAGMKVLAYDMGAIPERLPVGCGILISLDSSIEKIVATILDLASQTELVFNLGQNYKDIINEYYEYKRPRLNTASVVSE
jgi:glycosyltransferase involved in cell wall biosynthesis